jgi:hypothetical protein
MSLTPPRIAPVLRKHDTGGWHLGKEPVAHRASPSSLHNKPSGSKLTIHGAKMAVEFNLCEGILIMLVLGPKMLWDATRKGTLKKNIRRRLETVFVPGYRIP